MTVTVLLFAQIREVAGSPEIRLKLHEPATVGDIRAALCDRFPALGAVLEHCAISVDQQYAGNDHVIREDSEIGCIPPVSGG